METSAAAPNPTRRRRVASRTVVYGRVQTQGARLLQHCYGALQRGPNAPSEPIRIDRARLLASAYGASQCGLHTRCRNVQRRGGGKEERAPKIGIYPYRARGAFFGNAAAPKRDRWRCRIDGVGAASTSNLGACNGAVEGEKSLRLHHPCPAPPPKPTTAPRRLRCAVRACWADPALCISMVREASAHLRWLGAHSHVYF